ncbi:hypothetical protein AAFX91_41680 [Bradyrhizobium sp. 31Argb]|uniref:hypothetical protein n=1 Tax=Bradyrhizobium sp. 31Argb TaxID=3141247 RepID=UPI003749C0F9
MQEPQDAAEFVEQLQGILDAMEIDSLPEDVASFLRFRMRRSDRLHATDAKLFPETGTDHVVMLVRSIAESTNGPAALTVPILRAVSSCTEPLWVERGSEWLEALDEIPLLELEARIRALDLADDIAPLVEAAIYRRLHRTLGSPLPPPPPKPKKAKPVKPDHISQESWDDAIEMQKARRREADRRRRKAKSEG